MGAFDYPMHHRRRHGPRGYVDIGSYRPWLRDEFCFRCVYCLLREQWGKVRGTFDIEHFRAVASHPEQEFIYDNLLYSCATCNGAKGTRTVPDPVRALTNTKVHVHEDGTIEGRSPAARRLIRDLGLDDSEYTEFRLLRLGIVALAKKHDPKLYRRLLSFPDNLPNLGNLRPPDGNSRPEGVALSYFTQAQQGSLPETY